MMIIERVLAAGAGSWGGDVVVLVVVVPYNAEAETGIQADKPIVSNLWLFYIYVYI